MQQLKHFSRYGGGSASPAQMGAWIAEADAVYNATLERGDYIDKWHYRAEQELEYFPQNIPNISPRKAKDLLKRVLGNKLNDTSFGIINERSATIQ